MTVISHKRTQEKPASTGSGGFLLVISLFAFVAAAWLFIAGIAMAENGTGDDVSVVLHIGGAIAITLASVLILCGLYSIQQNESTAITLFGNYKGTDKKPGLRWVVPWYSRKKISLRVRNVTSQTLKVNDKKGNPIEIAAVIVWRVVDTAQALFDVDNYETFVNIQIETSLREITSHFAYDHGEEAEPTLRADGEKVGEMLQARLQERIGIAGLVVDEARLSHLAYAPEIASSMLRRQQAEAVLEARAKIVTGAVSMVESALQQLSERDIVSLDDERKAAMVSNLLVVLCADREAQPVVNTGSLYQ
ncbi:MAG TPA: SPFH domain-containing protein [Hyphomonadaceae bacterium]|nr:SPFH domain-containing protein [Hyphomonadaceae bacterium]HPN04887.1 SPFH domain-containing protein [Hyphomonadaceae bacterium]